MNKQKNHHRKIVAILDNKNMIDDFIERIKLKCVITNESNVLPDVVNIIKGKILNGFIINDIVCISPNEIYGKTTAINYKTKFRYGTKIKDITKLSIGDYVVHSTFGIGKYLGIVTLSPKGLKKDYLHIEYKDNDKLYIPVEIEGNATRRIL